MNYPNSMKKLLLALLIVSGYSTLSAQVNTEPNGTPSNQRFALSIGFYGFSGKNPGIQIGLENYLATTQNFQIIGGLFLQLYSQKEKQSGIAINARIGQRYTSNAGLMFESYLGIGPEWTTYKSRVSDYALSKTSIEKKSKWGIIPNIAIGAGFDSNRISDSPLLYYLRSSASWLIPDRNLLFQSKLNLEAGVVHRLGTP